MGAFCAHCGTSGKGHSSPTADVSETSEAATEQWRGNTLTWQAYDHLPLAQLRLYHLQAQPPPVAPASLPYAAVVMLHPDDG